jgi:predicted kinase
MAGVIPESDRSAPVIVFVGIQASGKTTFYRRFLAGTHVHVSMDNWPDRASKRNREREAILECLQAGKPFVVDNTNPARADRERYFEYARLFGVPLIAYFFESNYAACMDRNNSRDGRHRIPEAGVQRAFGRLEPPTVEEGFAAVRKVRIVGEGFEIE